MDIPRAAEVDSEPSEDELFEEQEEQQQQQPQPGKHASYVCKEHSSVVVGVALQCVCVLDRFERQQQQYQTVAAAYEMVPVRAAASDTVATAACITLIC